MVGWTRRRHWTIENGVCAEGDTHCRRGELRGGAPSTVYATSSRLMRVRPGDLPALLAGARIALFPVGTDSAAPTPARRSSGSLEAAVSWMEIAGWVVALVVALWLLRNVIHFVASSIRCIGTLLLVALAVGLLAIVGRYVLAWTGGG